MRRTITILLVTAALAAAQIPAGFGIGQTMKQNAENLKHYTYKRRTEIKVKDKSRGARVDLVRYVDGKTETIPLETQPRPEQSGHGQGLRAKIIEKKIEQKKDEMKKDKERMEELLRAYLSPGSDSMRTMLERAAISRTGPGPNADVKVVATGVVKPSDSFSLVWSIANHRPVSIEIRAELDGKPVHLTRDYAALKDGTFYPVHTAIAMPGKDVIINIDTFDYSNSGESKP